MKTKRINVFIIMIAVAFMMALCGCRILGIRPSTEEEVDEAKEQGIISDDATTDDTVTVTLEVTDEEISEIPITEEYFPDEVFRQYISDKKDKDKNGVLSPEEIKEITSIYVKGYLEGMDGVDEYPGIYSVDGIQYFPYLTRIGLWAEPVEKIDLSNNTNLFSLDIMGCNITKIDLSNNKVLVDAINCAESARITEVSNRTNDPGYYTTVSYIAKKGENGGSAIIFQYDYGTEVITGDYSINVTLEDKRQYDDCCFYDGIKPGDAVTTGGTNSDNQNEDSPEKDFWAEWRDKYFSNIDTVIFNRVETEGDYRNLYLSDASNDCLNEAWFNGNEASNPFVLTYFALAGDDNNQYIYEEETPGGIYHFPDLQTAREDFNIFYDSSFEPHRYDYMNYVDVENYKYLCVGSYLSKGMQEEDPVFVRTDVKGCADISGSPVAIQLGDYYFIPVEYAFPDGFPYDVYFGCVAIEEGGYKVGYGLVDQYIEE